MLTHAETRRRGEGGKGFTTEIQRTERKSNVRGLKKIIQALQCFRDGEETKEASMLRKQDYWLR
jgi:hypothetical protein